MKTLLCLIVFGVLGGSWLQGAPVTLVKDGQAECHIVIPAKPGQLAWFGAWELKTHLEEITGARIPVFHEDGTPVPGPGEDPGQLPKEAGGVRLIVGDSLASREFGLKAEDFKSDEYAIQFSNNAIIMIGRDEFWNQTPGLEFRGMGRTWIDNIDRNSDHGTMNAVYDFLEKYCDVRWFHHYSDPNDFGTYLSKTNTLTVLAKNIRRTPVFPLRRAPFNTEWFGQNSHDRGIYELRNKFGGKGFIVGHSFYGFTDRFWKQSPERPEIFEEERHDYFGQGYTNGPWDVWITGCPPQPCLTSTGFIAQVVKDARDYFDGKGLKYRSEANGDMYGLGLNDNNMYCKCDNCRKLVKTYEHDAGGCFNTDHASLLYWTFVKKVADEIRKTHPGKQIIGYSYFDVAAYPDDLELPDNVGVVYAYFDRVPSGKTGEDLALYKEWPKKCRGRMPSVWLYPTFPKETADGQKWNCFWAMHGRHLSKTMRMLADDGVQGIMPCGPGEIVDQWLYAKLYDDPYQDIDALLTDFFSKYFGPAGKPLQKMYNEMESIYYNTNNHPGGQFHTSQEVHWTKLGTPAVMARFQSYMDKAYVLAKEKRDREHVEFWDRHIWQYMVEGRRQFMGRLDEFAHVNDPGSPRDGLGWAGPELDTADWHPIELPGRFDMFVQVYSNVNGICWFRKTFKVTPSMAGKPVVLSLGPVDDSDTTWINGTRVGDGRGLEEKRVYQVPAGVLKPGENVIAIRVYDGGMHGGFKGDKKDMWLRPTSATKSGGINLGGKWLHKLGTTNEMGWGKL